MSDGVGVSAPTNTNDSAPNTNTDNVSGAETTQNSGVTQNVNQNIDTQQVNNSDTSSEQKSEEKALDSLYDMPKDTPQNLQIPEQYSFVDAETGSQFSAEDTAEFGALCKEVGLSQEQATKLFNAYSADVKEQFQEHLQIFKEQAQQENKQTQKAWRNAIMQDPEIGGENFQTTRMNIAKVMQKYGSPELSKFLNESGIGYNPDVVRFFARIGSGITDDNSFIRGVAPQVENAIDVAKRRYPNSPRMWN